MAIDDVTLAFFIMESNRIEGISPEMTKSADQVAVYRAFLDAPLIGIEHLKTLVKEIAPHAELRDRHGLNVRVGSHIAPAGGPAVRDALSRLLRQPGSAYNQHIAYETLHPFTDGNGRSGRAMWLWRMIREGEWWPAPSFLHAFYYQTLAASRAEHPEAVGPEER